MDPAPVPFAPNQKIAQPKGQYHLIFQQLRIFPEGSTVTITFPPESSFKQHNIHLIKYQQDVLEQSYERGKVILFQVDPAAQQVRYQLFISKFRMDIIAKFIQCPFQYPKNPCIGAGGFGECYVIQKNKESPKKCLKVIRFKNPQVRYFEIMDTVRQVGICKLLGFLGIGPFIYDVGGFDFLVFDNCIYYQMELCEPLDLIIKNLKEQTGNQSQREEILQNVKKNLVQNIYLLHSLKLVHKDIKPENILYSKERGRYVFCDFGLTHSVQQNWDKRTRVAELGGTPGYMCGEMQTLFEKKHKGQKISPSQKMVNLYYNDQFALQRTLKSISEIESETFIDEDIQSVQKKLEKRQKMSFQQEMVNLQGNGQSALQRTLKSVRGKPSVVRDVQSEYFERQIKKVPRAQRIQFLKGAYGCTLPLLMHWREHISSLKGQNRSLQQKKYHEYIASFKIPYWKEQLDKLEILLLQRGIADRVYQQSDASIIYCFLIVQKCKDPKLLLRCLQYMTSNNISSILTNPFTPIVLEGVKQGLLDAMMKALNYLQERLDSPGNSMQQQFFTLCRTLVLGEYPFENTLQQLSGKYASSALEFVNLVRQFQSPQHLEELLSLSEIAVYCFLKRNSFYQEFLYKQSRHPFIQSIRKIQEQLHAPFDQLMQLKRRRNRYYELSTLKLYCKALLLYSQNKASAREMIPQLLQEAGKVYDELCQGDPWYSYTPEAGILNMFRGTVYKLIPSERERALESSFEALHSIREHYGEGNHYMPQIKKNIAQILQEMGQYDWAKQFYLEAVHLVLTDQGRQLRNAVMTRRIMYSINVKMDELRREPLKMICENQYRKFLDLALSNPQGALRHVQVQLQFYHKARRQKGVENQEQWLAVEFMRYLSTDRSFFRYDSPHQSEADFKFKIMQMITQVQYHIFSDPNILDMVSNLVAHLPKDAYDNLYKFLSI